MNTYGYVYQNPLMYIDPTGERQSGGPYGLGNGSSRYSQSNAVARLAEADLLSPNSECKVVCKITTTPVCVWAGIAGSTISGGVGIVVGAFCDLVSTLVCNKECNDFCPLLGK